jgi:sec-independent protein translocase protein TatB
MFDIGWGELVVIGVIALIVIGPKELPAVLRTLGQTMGKVKRMAGEFQGQFQEAMREAELDDLKKQAQDLTSSVTDITNFDPMADTQAEVERALEAPADPAPVEPPAADATPPDTVPTESTAAAEPDGAALAGLLPSVDVPPPGPLTDKDFAAAEPAPPPPKQAGGAA